MIFRVILLLFVLAPVCASASRQSYEMMPGHYVIKAEATDTEESYPVDISLTIGELGELKEGNINYPTYDCMAAIINTKQSGYLITFKEKMAFGYDTCEASEYFVKINVRKLFSPHQRGYIHFHAYDEGQEVKIEIDRFNFTPTKTATYRIQEKASTINDLFSTTNSIILRHLNNSSSHNFIKDKAKSSLSKLIKREHEAYEKIAGSYFKKALTDYLVIFPGSPHTTQVKKEIQIIDYRNLGSADGYYAAYLLSHENVDIEAMLERLKSINSLLSFVEGKKDLPKLQHRYLRKNLCNFSKSTGSLACKIKLDKFNRLNYDLIRGNHNGSNHKKHSRCG